MGERARRRWRGTMGLPGTGPNRRPSCFVYCKIVFRNDVMLRGYYSFIVVLLFPALIPAFRTSSEIVMCFHCLICMFLLLFVSFLWDPGFIPKRDNYDVNVCARISVIFWHPFADRAKLL